MSSSRVSRPWRSSTRIGRTFLGSTMRAQEAIGRFRSDQPAASGFLQVGGESRHCRTTEEEFRVVPIARNGGLAVTMPFYERLAVTRMECVTSWRALYIMSMPQRTRSCRASDEPKRSRVASSHDHFDHHDCKVEQRERFLVKMLVSYFTMILLNQKIIFVASV